MDGSHEFAWVDTNSFRENPFNPFLHCSYYNDETLLAGGKNLECGDLSPLLPLWRLVAKAGPRPAAHDCWKAFEGDKSPAESAGKSAHSKAVAASARWFYSCSLGKLLFSK